MVWTGVLTKSEELMSETAHQDPSGPGVPRLIGHGPRFWPKVIRPQEWSTVLRMRVLSLAKSCYSACRRRVVGFFSPLSARPARNGALVSKSIASV